MKTQRTLIMLLAIATMPCLANAQINDPKFYTPIDGWPFAQGGHTGDRVARISGNVELGDGEPGESRSALTLPNPVTGNVRFEAWFYTGNGPNFDASNNAIGGNTATMEITFHDSQDSGPGIHDHYNGTRNMFYLGTRSGWLGWETGTIFDGSERFCGDFRGDCGVPTIVPETIPGLPSPLPAAVKGIFPPLDEWWGLQIDLDWDPEKERYITWDLSYKQDSHEGWIPLTTDQRFADFDGQSDADGYLHNFDEFIIFNRPLEARGLAWTYFDDISLISLDDPEADPIFETSFEESEGWKLGPLQGQPDTQIPPDLAENNTHTGWQFWGHVLPEGADECPFNTPTENHFGCDVGSVHELEEPATFNPNDHLALQVVQPLGGLALPGDIDGDGDIDFTDFSTLAGNFTGTLNPGEGGKTRDQGDFDDDGDVDFGDFSVLAGNFTGTITAAASAGDVPDEEGDVQLEIDLTNGGAMTLQPNSANMAGYSIRSPDSQLVADADGAAAPFMFYLLNAPQEVTAGSVGATTMLTEDLLLDIAFDGDEDEANRVVFQYTRAGEVTPVDGVVHVIPEPATMMLLAAGGLMVMPRRRRRCA